MSGWSSPVARQAHNLEVAGAKPAPDPTSRSSRRKAVPAIGDGSGCGLFLDLW